MRLHHTITITLALSLSFGALACGDDAEGINPTESSETEGDEAAANEGDSGDAATAAEGATGDDTAADEASEQTGDEATAEGEASDPWGAICLTDADCAAPTNFCVVNPMSGSEEGYCSIECPNAGADCTYEDWTCNVVGGCDSPIATWCGPPAEIDEGGGVLSACE